MLQQATEAEGGTYDPVVSLRAMTRKAISILSEDKDGCFLVVAEEAVDEMAHSNNAALTIEGVNQLDRAVAVGKRFAKRTETLSITTADHETGGMAIKDTGTEDESCDGDSAEDGPFPIPDSKHQFKHWPSPSPASGCCGQPCSRVALAGGRVRPSVTQWCRSRCSRYAPIKRLDHLSRL